MSGPRDWLPALLQALQGDSAVVRVVLVEVRGSAPRESGAGMLVGPAQVLGSIGGGRLEWEAIAAAHALLEDSAVCARLSRVVLGADRGQCCGGVVTLWLERYSRREIGLLQAAKAAADRGCASLISVITPSGIEHRVVHENAAETAMDRARRAPRLTRNADGGITLRERLDDELPAVWVYGAGHVGQALARMLTDLPLRLTWIDSRDELCPAPPAGSAPILRRPDPVASVVDAPAGMYFVVLTHSHPLDYSLCRAILRRNDFAWLGLIGSHSKAARFRSRLARDGLGVEAIGRLVCPIGVGGIASKWPAAIAVGVAAQLLRVISAAALEQTSLHSRDSRDSRDSPQSPAMETVCVPGGCASCGSADADSATSTAP
jgi:xanthine dehydrogenase accessory factor